MTGKSWSYKLALAIPVLLVVGNILITTLYMTAPVDLGIREGATENVVSTGMGVFWAILILFYLRQSHVKEYLRVSIQKAPIMHAREPEPRRKFFCRYCGAKNKPDAKFCERCGKKL